MTKKLQPGRFARQIILSAALAAMALTAHAETYPGASTIIVANSGQRPLYIAFSVQPGKPGPVVWSKNCERFNDQVYLPPGESCKATVQSSVGSSRFCAAENPVPPGKTPNCYAAQRDNLTMIETNFTSGNGCDPTNQSSCVWYDISIVPESCTNCEWAANNCNNSGGASYNVPVQLSCNNAMSFMCRGPIGTIGTFGAKYPVNCGTPLNQPACAGGVNAACVQAYFFPMSTAGACQYPASKPQPIAQCPQKETLVVNFLGGQ